MNFHRIWRNGHHQVMDSKFPSGMSSMDESLSSGTGMAEPPSG